MDVLLVKPNQKPMKAQIDNDLKSMQDMVKGYIEIIRPFEDSEVALVCNEEGKMNNAPINRLLVDKDGTVVDYIAGDFFVTGTKEDDFVSLSDKMLNKYKEKLADKTIIL